MANTSIQQTKKDASTPEEILFSLISNKNSISLKELLYRLKKFLVKEKDKTAEEILYDAIISCNKESNQKQTRKQRKQLLKTLKILKDAFVVEPTKANPYEQARLITYKAKAVAENRIPSCIIVPEQIPHALITHKVVQQINNQYTKHSERTYNSK